MTNSPQIGGSSVASREGVQNTQKASISGLRFDANAAFIILYSIMPLVDSINGMIVRGGSSSFLTIGDVYRLLVIAASVLFFLYKPNRSIVAALSVGASLGFATVLLHAITKVGSGSTSELNLLLQWMLSPILVLCTYSTVKCGTLRRQSIGIVLDWLQWLAPMTILVPYALGLGYSTYGTGSADGSFVGYKAFYYATNGISLMLIVLFTRAVYCFLNQKSFLALTVVILNGASLALIGTKSSLAMLVLAFIVALYSLYGDRFLRFLTRLLPVIIVLFTAIYFMREQIGDFLSPILGRWDYFSTRVYSNDLIGALTSGRIYQVSIHWGALASSPLSFLLLFFGMGDLSKVYRICEMDYFDIFFQFGIFGLLLLLAFISFVVSKGYRANGNRCFELCIVVLLVLYALIVGHVFNNAMSSMVFSLVAVLAMTTDSDQSCPQSKMTSI